MAAPEKLSDIVTSFLDVVHDRLISDTRGTVADYIPQLAEADPELFGIALCGLNGHVYESGDTGVEFTIQSASKPFVYSLALDDRGLDAVHSRVGAEPSGEAFNSVKLEAITGRPPNPMVNAGAIVTTSLVAGDTPEDRFARILARLSAFAGRDPTSTKRSSPLNRVPVIATGRSGTSCAAPGRSPLPSSRRSTRTSGSAPYSSRRATSP